MMVFLMYMPVKSCFIEQIFFTSIREKMDIRIYSLKQTSDERLLALLRSHQSFVLEDIGSLKISEAVEAIEKKIESLGMTCRIYSKWRVTTLVTKLSISLFGWDTASVLGANNRVTWNPDYEIGKNRLTRSLTIEYKNNL
jgi:hypothetical protein